MSDPQRTELTSAPMAAPPTRAPRGTKTTESGQVNGGGSDLVALSVCGRELRIRSDEPRGHLEALARYVDDRLAQIAGPKKVELPDPNLLLITALQLADEVFKMKREREQLAARLRDSSRSLLGRLGAHGADATPASRSAAPDPHEANEA